MNITKTAIKIGDTLGNVGSSAKAKVHDIKRKFFDTDKIKAKPFVPMNIPKGTIPIKGESNIDAAGISEVDIERMKVELAKKESRGHGGYQAENQWGFLGKWQMGVGELETLGMMKKGTYARLEKGAKHRDLIYDDKNWLHGLNRERFLNDSELQDRLIDVSLRRKIRTIRGKVNKKKPDGKTWADMDRKERVTLMATSHISGARGAYAIRLGNAGSVKATDANNTNKGDYGRDVAEQVLKANNDAANFLASSKLKQKGDPDIKIHVSEQGRKAQQSQNGNQTVIMPTARPATNPNAERYNGQ
tara:strand:+ start:1 stop:909 length:909 start_codon:yes stop_codon:yes gene_type:complete